MGSGQKNEIRALSEALLSGVVEVLGDKLFGLYVYGAAAFPDAVPTGDLDFHAIVREGLGHEEKSGLRDLHAALATDFAPLGEELDGYYLLLEEARGAAPPNHQILAGIVDNSWALHRAHILAGRCIVLYGPDPKEIYLPADWPELEHALHGELQFVEEHLDVYPDYCILNLCRLMYSFETRDVVISKAQAAAWARDAVPEWQWLVELAIKSYARQATAADRTLMLEQVPRLYEFACQRFQKGCA